MYILLTSNLDKICHGENVEDLVFNFLRSSENKSYTKANYGDPTFDIDFKSRTVSKNKVEVMWYGNGFNYDELCKEISRDILKILLRQGYQLASLRDL